jgi:exonuclease III
MPVRVISHRDGSVVGVNRTPTLRIASQNIRCGRNVDTFESLVTACRAKQLHVVAVQEMHADFFQVPPLQSIAARHAYRMYYSICAANSGLAGVAFLVSRSVADGVDANNIMKDDSGRIITMPLNWRGHRLSLINAYVPNDPQDAKRFLLDVVRPALAECGGRQPVLLGDFNFVVDVRMDRVRTADTAAARDMSRTASDSVCSRVFQRDIAHDMIDTFRKLHPARKGMSFFYRRNGRIAGAARLDRVYVRDSLMPSVTSSDIVNIVAATDHRAVVVNIIPSAAEVGAATQAHKARRNRVRMFFWDCGVLREQFKQWLSSEAAAAPVEHVALLMWWTDFKRRLAAFVASLNADRRRQALPPAALHARREAARQALDAAHHALESGQPGAQQLVMHAQGEWASALREVQQHQRVHGTKIEWLHPNERPSPAFTALVAPPKYSKVVQALQHPRGHLVGPGRGQSDIMVNHYASISAVKPCDNEAVSSVCEAIRKHGPVGLPQEDTDVLGDVDVSEEEVVHALRRSPSGKSPGLDGIPVELYRRGSSALAPLLARVYSAMGHTGQMPRAVLDGLITSLHKTGDRTNPEQYRPITLLNTDYRVLAKVLANRLLRCMGTLISPEQSAFVRGRHIGNGVMLLQLLPHVMARQRHAGAVVAFMDFKKAYDTVNRAFLLRILSEFGVGAGFIKWVSMLLSDTRALAVVNGFFSSKAHFGAGVRQGCPLAPLLYLFVAESLLRFLKDQEHLGLVVAGRKLLANQFADDMQVFLHSVRAVPNLVQAMHVFEQASGQALNHGKSSLLPIGPLHSDTPPPATLVDGIPVRQCAAALGFSFAAGLAPPTPADGWDALVQKVDSKITTLARLPLSVFGRAVGASSYAVSKLLYHAEFLDSLSDAQISHMQANIAALVDRKSRPGFTFVPHECLLGAAKQGGFGVLPLHHHLTARRAVWAVRLLCGCGTTPWIFLGRQLLASAWGVAPWHVMLPLHASGQSPTSAHYGGGSRLPPPLYRLLHALHQLPTPIRDTNIIPPPTLAASCCAAMPVVSNSLFVNDGGEGLQGEAGDFQHIGAHTLGRVLILDRLLAGCATDAAWEHGPWKALNRVAANHWRDREVVRDRVDKVLSYVPLQWQAAAKTHMHHDAWPFVPEHLVHVVQPEYQKVAETLRDQLVWAHDTLPNSTLPLSMLTVRHASAMLMQPVVARRVERWRDFLVEACDVGGNADLDHALVPQLQRLLAKLWKLGWHNERKVIFWRLCVNGLPFSSRFNTGKSCVCNAVGADNPGRLHHFWHCEAAQAVIGEMQQGLLQCGNIALERRHVWLMEVPTEVKQRYNNSVAVQQLWRVVCLAALNAMSHYFGHVMNAAPHAREAWQNEAGDGNARGHIAATRFREMLEEFARVGTPPKAWHRVLPADAPFLRYSGEHTLKVIPWW